MKFLTLIPNYPLRSGTDGRFLDFPRFYVAESPEDAFDWCASVIPNMKRSQMQKVFDKLTPIQGSKARAWYFKVIELYNY